MKASLFFQNVPEKTLSVEDLPHLKEKRVNAHKFVHLNVDIMLKVANLFSNYNNSSFLVTLCNLFKSQ